MTDLEDPVEAQPWREGDGPQPSVWTWPLTDPPALWVRQNGSWRWAPVTARQDWPDGRVAYQVLIDTDGTTSKSHRTYWWPHNGLRVAHRSAADPTTEAGRGGDLPRPPRRVKFA
ncbi:hypothetical protein OHB33_41165 (plasmid) [Streptomyces sp. NBC_01558]|uniref:hypothetical protein n=1 Tax=Streptomyces sp. NBC_01558 TaxID=2975878 RepID=UPI002DDBDD35|nr:hypothetical protein [Streptomyces sp. NBC_01558]WSD82797.1 hypothetical protein OHB33_41165 [Streptomyces sp. NBC_01558]